MKEKYKKIMDVDGGCGVVWVVDGVVQIGCVDDANGMTY
jgi:hypothetical protein